jgi:hypothetical protein
VDVYVLAATILAVVLVVLRVIGPHEWRHPTKWRMPQIGPALLVWFGCASVTAAVKLGVLVLKNEVRIQQASSLDKLNGEEIAVFLGGAFGAALVGLITVRDGWRRLFG